MGLVCKKNMCAGCSACIEVCPVDAITIVDDIVHMNAFIDNDKCIGCGSCHRVCQSNHPAVAHDTNEAWQGWARDDIRTGSSSGGFATAIEEVFIAQGGVLASCKLRDGQYVFDLATKPEQLKGFAGSKYVKSNPIDVYKPVEQALKEGNHVLFVGLPCQVSAMRNYLDGRCDTEGFYTIDLICHGTPSIKILRKALGEYGYCLDDLKEVFFRENELFGLRVDAKRLVYPGVVDPYLTAFLRGGCYTENCYSCPYARQERVSDLTLGDSWGTEFKSEEVRGVSLALVQTSKGRELLDMANLNLLPVDYEHAVANNHQLEHPTQMDEGHDIFFKALLSGKTVRQASFRAYPSYRAKQWVKACLYHFGMRRRDTPLV